MDESSRNTTGLVPNKAEVLALRYYNDAVIGLDLLYVAALRSHGARQELHAEADRLVRRGAQWRDLKYKGKK
jgi:hypothetical protein